MVRLLLASAATAALTACAGPADGAPEGMPGGAEVAVGSARTAPGPAGSGALEPLGQATTGTVESADFPDGGHPVAQLTDVRAAGHETFGRVVLEFAERVPEYRVQYVEPPIIEDGSGREVTVPGEAFLQIVTTPASAVELSGEQPNVTYDGPKRMRPPYAQVITQVVQTGDFEAVLTWTVGLDRRVPYGVAALQDPPRLVVDVRHESSPGNGDGRGIAPVGPGGTEDVSEEGSGGPAVVTDVRLGAHHGFDRIVFQLAGAGEAGYGIGYVEDPRSQGSGHPVDVPGDAALAIELTNILLPPDAPPGVEPWEAPEQLAIRDAQVIEALVVDSLFEGRYSFFAGVNEPRPFAVERLEDPQRIVVDVLTGPPGGGDEVVLGESCTSPVGLRGRLPVGLGGQHG